MKTILVIIVFISIFLSIICHMTKVMRLRKMIKKALSYADELEIKYVNEMLENIQLKSDISELRCKIKETQNNEMEG